MKTRPPNRSLSRVPPKWKWHYHKLRSLRDLLMEEQEDFLARCACPRPPCNFEDANRPPENLHAHLFVGIFKSEQNSLTEVDSAIQSILDGTYDGSAAPRASNKAGRMNVSPNPHPTP